MSKDVNLKILDGGLGSVDKGEEILGVVGVGSSAISGISLVTRDNYEEKVGLSPVRDFLEQVFSMVDVPIYCRVLEGTTVGACSEVTKGSNTGVGSLAVSGNPTNLFSIQVKIIDEGTLDTPSVPGATFRYNIDGVESDIITIPQDGVYSISGTGITLTFTAGSPAENSFKSGDLFSFSTTAPTATNAELLAGVNDLIASSYDIVHISVAAVTQFAFWSSFAVTLEAAEDSHKYITGSTMARYINEGEALDDYITALTGSERGSVVSKYLMVCASWIEENDVSGYIDIRNALGKIIGRKFSINIALSPGATKLGSLPGVEKIMPEDGNNPFPYAHVKSLEASGYATLINYDGKIGVYVNDSTVMTEATSDFNNLCKTDVINKARRLIRGAQFPFIKDNFDVLGDGTIPQLEIVKAAADDIFTLMIQNKEISSGYVELPIDQNILSDPEITEKVYIIPRGSFTEISGTIQYKNPN